MDLTKKIKEIRKFSRFGLISLSSHCMKRCQERNVSQSNIIKMLCDNNNSIVQNHNRYKNNKNPTYVIWAKLDKKTYHIVVEDETSELGAHHYCVETVYEPSKEFFSDNGRRVKPKNLRGFSNSHY